VGIKQVVAGQGGIDPWFSFAFGRP